MRIIARRMVNRMRQEEQPESPTNKVALPDLNEMLYIKYLRTTGRVEFNTGESAMDCVVFERDVLVEDAWFASGVRVRMGSTIRGSALESMVDVGEGNLFEQTIIGPGTLIGNECRLSGAHVGGRNNIADRVRMRPGAVTRRDTWLGTGCVIDEGAEIGAYCRLGSGGFVGSFVQVGDNVSAGCGIRVYCDVPAGVWVSDSEEVVDTSGPAMVRWDEDVPSVAATMAGSGSR